jgi:hypothetical protein
MLSPHEGDACNVQFLDRGEMAEVPAEAPADDNVHLAPARRIHEGIECRPAVL